MLIMGNCPKGVRMFLPNLLYSCSKFTTEQHEVSKTKNCCSDVIWIFSNELQILFLLGYLSACFKKAVLHSQCLVCKSYNFVERMSFHSSGLCSQLPSWVAPLMPMQLCLPEYTPKYLFRVVGHTLLPRKFNCISSNNPCFCRA